MTSGKVLGRLCNTAPMCVLGLGLLPLPPSIGENAAARPTASGVAEPRLVESSREAAVRQFSTALSGPTFTYSPTTVAHGESISVTGRGFSASATGAIVYLGRTSEPRSQIVVGSTGLSGGSFGPASFTIRDTIAPGTYFPRVDANDGSATVTSAVTLTVTP